jgi:D-lactate dehydrogenase
LVKVAVFSTKPHDVPFLTAANADAGAGYELAFRDVRLGPDVLPLAAEAEALCPVVNDDLSAPIIAGFPNT